MGFFKRLQDAGFPDYNAYLASPQWSDFRKRYRDAGLPLSCAVCGGVPVQLHHHTYDRICDELLADVTPLCREDHIQVHACLKTFKWDVKKTTEAIARLKAGERFDPSLVTAEKPPKAKRKKKKKRTKAERRQQREEKARRRQAAKILAAGAVKKDAPAVPKAAPGGVPDGWHNRVAEYNSLRAKVLQIPPEIPADYVPDPLDPLALRRYVGLLVRQRTFEKRYPGVVRRRKEKIKRAVAVVTAKQEAKMLRDEYRSVSRWDDPAVILRAIAAGIRPKPKPSG